jgi:class 3 adenylate cyclase/pimeloyl-ACP methyl ester carboxylesterase
MAMQQPPETRYVGTPEGSVAYQVLGEGPRDLLFIQNWASNIEVMWDEPAIARYFERLAGFARVIVFDKRGTGISDPVPLERLPTLERWMDDARVVLDAVGSVQAVVLGDTEGGPMAMLLAATDPSRVAALVLVNSFARLSRATDYRIGLPLRTRERLIEGWRREWGTGAMLELTAPGLAGDARARRWFGRYQRLAMAPQQAERAYRWVLDVDVRSVLGSIQAPTLVIQRLGNRYYRPAYGRYLADHIPGARLVELPGADVYPFHVDPVPVLAEIETYLTGVRPKPPPTRVLATVLFTDIVDSTGHATRLGDDRWADVRASHNALVRELLARYGGKEVGTTGDGFLATFDGPGRALRCAVGIVTRVRDLGLEVRAGAHTGEIDLAGDDISGIAVHIAARVVSAAAPSTAWVTGTVRDLVIGSGIAFSPRGEHELKGVPGRWPLYEVESIE